MLHYATALRSTNLHQRRKRTQVGFNRTGHPHGTAYAAAFSVSTRDLLPPDDGRGGRFVVARGYPRCVGRRDRPIAVPSATTPKPLASFQFGPIDTGRPSPCRHAELASVDGIVRGHEIRRGDCDAQEFSQEAGTGASADLTLTAGTRTCGHFCVLPIAWYAPVKRFNLGFATSTAGRSLLADSGVARGHRIVSGSRTTDVVAANNFAAPASHYSGCEQARGPDLLLTSSGERRVSDFEDRT